jgi:hypothetical protein
LANLDSSSALYFDFTGGKGVGTKHQLWGEVKSATVKNFFQLILTGERGEGAAGFAFDPHHNAYRIE